MAMYPATEKLLLYRERSLAQCHCTPAYQVRTYFSYGHSTPLFTALDALGGPVPGGDLEANVTRALARLPVEQRTRMGVLPLPEGLTAYGLMPTTWQDTIVYGFLFDSSSLPQVFREARDNGDLLPEALTRGHRAEQLLALEVETPDGTRLYQDGTWPDTALIRSQQLAVQAGGLIVRAAVQPAAADLLVGGGLAPSTRTLYWGVGTLAILLAVVALVQLRREAALARMRTDFVAAVSHELRTPLAQIRLFLETVRLGRYQTDQQRDWLMGNVDREADRMSHLVENLLLFSRLSRGDRGPSVADPLDLGKEAGDILDGFAPLAASRKVEFARELPAGGVVRIDRDRFRQAVINLLDNAVKFGPLGQTVTVQVEPGPERVRLRVRDQGPGIPPEEATRIWEPFFRGESAAARAVGGSGIGLALVRDLVQQVGGTALLEDTGGQGASIVLDLPAAA